MRTKRPASLHRQPALSLVIAAATLALVAGLSACNTAPQPTTNTSTITPAETPAASNHARRGHAQTAPPGTFDFYLLNLSWSPEFCHSHPTAAECAAHSTFVMHGLWPENTNGSYPEDCSDAPGPANPAQYSDLYPDPGLLEHEWTTHGTCSGLTADQFFTEARTAFQSVKIPPRLSQLSTQLSLPPAQILGLFAASNPGIPSSSLVLTCGSNYLTAVEVCLDKNLHPTTCGEVHSCGATTVKIPAP